MSVVTKRREPKYIGIDLFAGAGGMSLGARLAGIVVQLAIEIDPHAASTYKKNHPKTKVIVDDISNIKRLDVTREKKKTILFGGPPCQGFSTSNQRTRNKTNPANWLFLEFVRCAKLWKPDWVVIENVHGIIETEKGFFVDVMICELEKMGFKCSFGVLCASDYGVPQIRSRFFLTASRNEAPIEFPEPLAIEPTTVSQAIDDLPSLKNGANEDYLSYSQNARSNYAKSMRGGLTGCKDHLVTRNSDYVIKRYKYVPPGGNWENIPDRLMDTYTDKSRCHTGVYRRLREDQPSIVLGNFRKNMLIHPKENRGLSVREAARLQSFPDWYEFQGSIGYRQQQVANAVTPMLAFVVFSLITGKSYTNPTYAYSDL